MLLDGKAKRERDTCGTGYLSMGFGREMAQRLWE